MMQFLLLFKLLNNAVNRILIMTGNKYLLLVTGNVLFQPRQLLPAIVTNTKMLFDPNVTQATWRAIIKNLLDGCAK